MLRFLTRTPHDIGLSLIRIALGIVVLPHGLQKTLGWFDGKGIVGSIRFFEEALHIPPFWTSLAIIAESLGALALIVGFLSRVAAGGVLAIMVVAVTLIHGRWGFFMNWYGQPRGEGFEFHILAATMALVIILRGGGAYSVDRAWGSGR